MTISDSKRRRILALRRHGYRLWRIAADVKLPLHRVAAVLVEAGLPWRCGREREFRRDQ